MRFLALAGRECHCDLMWSVWQCRIFFKDHHLTGWGVKGEGYKRWLRIRLMKFKSGWICLDTVSLKYHIKKLSIVKLLHKISKYILYYLLIFSSSSSKKSMPFAEWPYPNDLMWSLRDLLCLKSDPQVQYQSLPQFFSWVLQSPFTANALPHFLHMKGLIPCFLL